MHLGSFRGAEASIATSRKFVVQTHYSKHLASTQQSQHQNPQ